MLLKDYCPFEYRDNDRGEHLVHVLNIVGQPGDKLAAGIFIEKCQVKPQHVLINMLPQPVHDILSGPFQDSDLKIVGDKTCQGGSSENNGQQRQP